MNMGENIGVITIGSLIGIFGAIISQPIWFLLLLAFLTGAMSYTGRICVKYIQSKFKKKA